MSQLSPASVEALQDQQVGLTQALFKLLPLHWDSDHVILHVPFKSEVSVSYRPWLSLTQALMGLGASLPVGAEPAGWGANEGFGSFTPWGEPLQL